MATRAQNVDYRSQLSERMTARNAARTVEQREQMIQAARQAREAKATVPYGNTHRWGKGQYPTPEAVLAYEMLIPFGFEPEVKVRTNLKRPAPGWYSLDFANVQRKIAVEIDGTSHLAAVRKEADARKDAFLLGHGWSVLRIPARWVQFSGDWIRAQCFRLKKSKPQVLRFTILK